MPQAVPIISAVVGVVGTVASIGPQRKASKARQKQETLSTRRSQRQAIREAQIRRAQALASAEGLGSAEGSGLAGGLSSTSSQLGGALGFSTEMSGLSRKVSKYTTRAGTYDALAGLGFTAFQASGGFDLFLGSKSPKPKGVI